MRKKIKKFSVSVVSLIFLSVSILGNLSLVQPAHAMPVQVATDVPSMVRDFVSKIAEGLKAAVITAGSRAAAYALRKVAYDSAVWLASGGKGQNPLAHTNGFGGYLENVGNEAAGTFIEDMGKTAGVNLCKIPDIKLDLAIKVGLRTNFSATQAKPSCTLTEFKKNWFTGAAWSKYASNNDLLKNFNASLSADDSDLGIYIAATEKINQKVAQQTASAVLDRQEGGGFKPLKGLINDQIKTPAKNISEVAQSLNPQTNFDKAEAQLNAALSGGDAKVFPAVLSIFLSTLGGTIINNYQTKGILPFGLCVMGKGGANCRSATSIAGSNNPLFNETGEGITSLGRAAAQNFFSYLTSARIQETNRFDLVSELNSCPENPGIYNCRAGDDLVDAINQQITIEQAIQTGVIDGNRKLIPNSSKFLPINNSIDCYKNAYCLNNVKILRQVRILPLGFEIAIATSSPDEAPTLRDVVFKFNDPTSRYYHLIDPKWVLKSPPSKCNALVSGPSLLSSDVPVRMQECVDLQTCVGYAENGTCNDYAYCTREKNTWKFPADSCAEQFATCRTFSDPQGNSVGYLTRTLDNAYCTADNAGCTAYSLTRSANGRWEMPYFNKDKGSNNGIYLNAKVDTNCSANSIGCSAFRTASSSDTVYLKKAPDYLGCYDGNPDTPNTLEWPRTQSDLSKIKGSSECSQYAKACIADEASCNWYTPTVGGGDRVPGKFTPAVVTGNSVVWNDQCDARCEGYNAYKEMPSNYSTGVNLAYIIPSSGKSCSAVDEGCSSFTNLNTAIGGVENVEYYSYLRPCVTMQEANSTTAKTFITYEGTKESGFQLKTYLMLANNTTNDPGGVNGVVGSPRYFYKDTDELNFLKNECTEQRYKDGVASLDCRQFNDQNGNIYYRMMSHTIPADEKCTGYRLNEPQFYTTNDSQTTCLDRSGLWDGVCKMCVLGGQYVNGACVYEGIPSGVVNSAGSSQSCSAEVNTCRAYKGNTGNNIQTVFNENFENASSTVGWVGAVSLSPVSTRVGGHSLEFDLAASFSKTLNLEPGRSYDITFWASSGRPANLTVSLVSGAVTNVLGTVSMGSTWRQYHLGPVEFTGSGPAALTFAHSDASAMFIDNIKLVKVDGYIYLVKNSLKVDAVCDSHPEDNLPGEALGCSGYSDPQNRKFYLTNFSFLCREDAIGCSALFDTFNTESKESEAHRVFIPAPTGFKLGSSLTRTIGTTEYSCKIGEQFGQSGCFINVPVTGVSTSTILNSIPGSLVTSTVFIPGDTPDSSPIYLVANKEASCSSADVGCSLAGRLQFNSSGKSEFVTTTIKNIPASYPEILCESPAMGCNAFSDGTANYYFKDPAVSGQKICTYQTDVPVKNKITNQIERKSGWFLKALVDENLYEPCYENYKNSVTGEYLLWSFADQTNYQNYVGACAADQDRCTKFVDHSDNDKAYYLKNDDKLSSGDCNGQVSQKSGCALFDQDDNLKKLWHTTTTYAASNAKDGEFVSPISADTNDSNIIIKVLPDRECGEWLQCASSYSVFDDQSNKYRNICKRVQRCDSNDGCGILADYSTSTLTSDYYQKRNVNWSGMDYSGYSLYGFYPLEGIEQVNLSASTDNPNWVLAKKVPCGTNCAVKPISASSCGLEGRFYVDNEPCGTTAVPGVCLNHICVQLPTGSLANVAVAAPKHVCRAYPENSAPFPSTKKITTSASFKSANICNEVDQYGCECNYRKVSYGESITKYWNYSGQNSVDANPKIGALPNDAPGVCLGGVDLVTKQTQDGKSCTNDSECGENGTCQLWKETRKFLGWKGFCLENDFSRVLNGDVSTNPCLTWYPIESLSGAADIYNQHIEAGSDWHSTPFSGAHYCISSKGISSQRSASLTISPSGLMTDLGSQDCWDMGLSAGAFGYPSCEYTDCSFNEGCTWSMDIFSRDIIDIPNQRKVINDGTFTSYPAVSDFIGVNKEEVSLIEIRAYSGTDGNFNIPVSGPFYLMPNDNPTGVPQSYYRLVNSMGESALAVGGFYRKDPNSLMFFYSSSDKDPLASDVGLNPNNGYFKFSYVKGTTQDYPGLSGYLFDNTSQLKAGTKNTTDIWDPTVNTLINGSHTNLNTQNWYDYTNKVGYCPTQQGLSDPANRNGNDVKDAWHAIMFKFDPVTSKLINIYTAFCGPAHGAENVVYQINIKTQETCSSLADDRIDLSKTTGLRTIAWTDRLWNISNNFKVPDHNYDYNTLNPAFGSLLGPIVTPPSFGPVWLGSTPTIICPNPATNPTNPITESNCSNLLTALERNFYTGSTYSCVGGSCSSGNAVSTIAEGRVALSTLFAANASSTKYDFNVGTYIGDTSLNVTKTGDSKTGVIPKPPEIHPLGSCVSPRNNSNSVSCVELPQQGFSIENQESGNVYADSGNGNVVSLDFYMFADKNQMPIRTVSIDWNDGKGESAVTGFFRNQRGVTSTDPIIYQCQNRETAADFGHILDQTCDNAYFHSENSYECFDTKQQCTDVNSTNCFIPPSSGLFADTCKAGINPEGCCVFRPKVKIVDNWGWWNGSCEPVGSTTGCYDPTSELIHPLLGIKFGGDIGGKVIVGLKK